MAASPNIDGCMRRQASTPAEPQKTASISVFLVEELGDARVRCEQLKGYVEEATDLIEKSEHRDHFFEVAGHLMHGIPEVLFKLEKALEAASMAASRIDYEEIKERLKPEKVEELEKALKDVRIRRLHRSDGQEPSVKDKSAATPKFDKRKVEQWMRHNVRQYVDRKTDEANSTELAEAAASEFNIYENTRDYKIPEEIYDMALDVAEKEGFGLKSARKDTPMNAKIAAYELVRIADHVDRTGSVPMDKLVSLIHNLEKGKREASASGADPKKVAGYFRALAENLAKTADDPNPSNKPSRFALAQSLRRVVADQMPMTSAQVAAQIYQQANSREEVMKGFHEANPDMTDADLEKAADMWEKHKDVVKDRAAE
jgi:hypothetical protein